MPGDSVSARDLLAFSRVQNQVAKNAVLAFRTPVGASIPPTDPPLAAAQSTAGTAVGGAVLDHDSGNRALGRVGRTDNRPCPFPSTTADGEGEKGNREVKYLVFNFHGVSERG